MAAGVPVRCEGAACRARAAVGRQPTTQHSEPPGSCFPAVSAIAEHRDALSMHAVPQPKGSQPRTLRALVPPEAPVAAVHELLEIGLASGPLPLTCTVRAMCAWVPSWMLWVV